MVFRPLTASNRLAAMNSFGTFLNRWQRTSLFRLDGTVLLTQFRTIRRGGAKEDTEHQTSSSSSKSHRFADAKQIEREINAEFFRFLGQSISKNGKTVGSFDEQLKSFVRDFNKRLPEFEVEASTGQQRDYMLKVFLVGFGLWIVGASAVDFEQFVQDYLMAGEVQMVYLYLRKAIAIAVLHPGAVIRGQPCNDSAVLIRLDSHMSTFKFDKDLRDVQNRIGVDLRDHVPLAVQQPLMSDVFLIIGWFILFALFFNKHGRAAGRQQLFMVKRKDGTGRAKSK
uniref:Uncharacterized protein n=1 Tax=Globodera rostochiensis TaxID=31243 RepID=A0A914GW73_GLORO